MEFLVDMVTTVPEGTSEEAVSEIRSREAVRSRELTGQGHLLRLWRPPLAPGEWRTWGLFLADDAEQLEQVLASMPLRVWRHDIVTPLSPHPSDPGPRAAVPAVPDAATMDREAVLRDVLDRWKAAVDAHEPQRVAAQFTEDAIFQGLHPYSVGRQGVADYYASQPLGMTAEYQILETRQLADDLVLGYLSVDFAFTDRATVAVNLSVLVKHTEDGWHLSHYQVSRLTPVA
ncbi:hypothetical protein Scani_19850 [Streptomyces caniferus]|uniref:Muconolactone isomerase domain-containing protein n=2 Tax=Streptomyces caniferus TaxID=285557 RepID=A0A640S401_9ACTN|nr:hypothetical protein Scani_19850 [Streptomyces caniferus]